MPHRLKAALGNVIHTEREKRGWSRDTLAEKMGSNNGAYYFEVENGRENLSCESMMKYCRAFEMWPVTFLLKVIRAYRAIERQEKEKADAQAAAQATTGKEDKRLIHPRLKFGPRQKEEDQD